MLTTLFVLLLPTILTVSGTGPACFNGGEVCYVEASPDIQCCSGDCNNGKCEPATCVQEEEASCLNDDCCTGFKCDNDKCYQTTGCSNTNCNYQKCCDGFTCQNGDCEPESVPGPLPTDTGPCLPAGQMELCCSGSCNQGLCDGTNDAAVIEATEGACQDTNRPCSCCSGEKDGNNFCIGGGAPSVSMNSMSDLSVAANDATKIEDDAQKMADLEADVAALQNLIENEESASGEQQQEQQAEDDNITGGSDGDDDESESGEGSTARGAEEEDRSNRSDGDDESESADQALFGGSSNSDHYGLNGNSNANDMDYNLMVSLSPQSLGHLWSICIAILFVNVVLFWCYYYKKNKNVSVSIGEHNYQKTDIDEPDV